MDEYTVPIMCCTCELYRRCPHPENKKYNETCDEWVEHNTKRQVEEMERTAEYVYAKDRLSE